VVIHTIAVVDHEPEKGVYPDLIMFQRSIKVEPQ